MGLEMITNYIDWDVLLKMVLALVFSAIIGYERERTGHPAGLRTHILVCVTSTFLMTAAQGVFLGDATARFAAAIITGIGFLGAGAIIAYGEKVFGLTTAASIWAIAGLGVVVGMGVYFEAIVATLVFFLVLRLKPIEKRKIKR